MGRFGNEYLAESAGYSAGISKGAAEGLKAGIVRGKATGYTEGWNAAILECNHEGAAVADHLTSSRKATKTVEQC